MKALYPTVLAATLSTLAVPAALAGISTSEATGICKAQASAEFAQAGEKMRVKFRGSGRKDGALQIRLQLYPQGADSFKATCDLDRQSGAIIALAREGAPAEGIAQASKN